MDNIITPLVGMAIGYFTNWLAIKMIFRPYEEKRIFGIKIPFTPGLIASERYRISKQIANVVSNNLLTDEDIKKSISSIDFETLTQKHLVGFLDKLQQSDKNLEDVLRNIFKDDFDNKKDDIVKMLVSNLNDSLFTEKTEEQIALRENTVKQFLYPILEIVETIFSYNLYNVDETIISILDDVLAGVFGGLSGMMSGLISSKKIYASMRNKIITTINESPEEIEEKLISIIRDNNYDKGNIVNINDLVKVSFDKVLEIKVCTISEKLEFVKDEEFINLIAEGIKNLISSNLNDILTQINVEHLVNEKIDEMPLSEIEEMIMAIAKKEISSITYIGGVLGFIIGLVPMFIK